MEADESAAGEAFARLCAIVRRLRAPGGCPWDREQTHESLAPGLLEEAYEVAEAIRAKDDPNLREELGDLLLQAVMHSEIAKESGRFQIAEVVEEVAGKLVRRHPHVFGESDARDTDAVLKQWDEIKRAEKGAQETEFFSSLTKGLPALLRAQKVQVKAARVGFDWPNKIDVLAKVEEELAETRAAATAGDAAQLANEIGDLFFSVVNLARKSHLDAETLLLAATDKFVRRFHAMERELQRQGKKLGEVDLTVMDEIWNEVKTENA